MATKRHKSSGLHSGTGICSFISTLFLANELNEHKLTDDEIAHRIELEFPNRPTAFVFRGPDKKRTINDYRNRYNRGYFHAGRIPSILSFRYNSVGNRVKGRTENIELTEEEIKQAIEAHNHARQSMESIRETGSEDIQHDS